MFTIPLILFIVYFLCLFLIELDGLNFINFSSVVSGGDEFVLIPIFFVIFFLFGTLIICYRLLFSCQDPALMKKTKILLSLFYLISPITIYYFIYGYHMILYPRPLGLQELIQYLIFFGVGAILLLPIFLLIYFYKDSWVKVKKISIFFFLSLVTVGLSFLFFLWATVTINDRAPTS